jgi:3-deoxy-D-manno-octulosonic-acid transferase
MQSDEDVRRITALGAEGGRVQNLGNIKYDLPEAAAFPDGDRLARAAGARAVLVAGSTGEGEEEQVLDAWRGLPDRPFLVLAPRRPERFDAVAALCESQGLRVLRRSAPDSSRLLPTPPNSPIDVYLLDSIGELASVYRCGALAFIGGSLIDTGGQNPIEAWAAGIPAVAGPHMENFAEVAARGEALGILTRVRDGAELSRRLEEAFGAASATATAKRGAEAARFVAENRGAAERTADALLRLVPELRQSRASAP